MNESNSRIGQWKKLFEKKIAPLVDEIERKKDPKPIFKMACSKILYTGLFLPGVIITLLHLQTDLPQLEFAQTQYV